MSFDLDTLKAQMQFGGARANKFEVIVANKVDISADEKFTFMCKGASLPVAELGSVDLFYKGRAIKVIGDRPPFPNWVVTVYNDEDFKVRNAFERWNSAMNAHRGNVMVAPISTAIRSYKSDALVKHFSMGGETVIKTVELIGMFPVRIGEIALDWETTNQIETFEVEFAYDYWFAAGTTEG